MRFIDDYALITLYRYGTKSDIIYYSVGLVLEYLMWVGMFYITSDYNWRLNQPVHHIHLAFVTALGALSGKRLRLNLFISVEEKYI